MNLSGNLQRVAPAEELELLKRLGRMAAECGNKLCLVGGSVRDVMTGIRGPDMDLALEGDVAQFAREAASEMSLEYVVHKSFGTATLTSPDGLRVDVATARRETYAQPGSLPEVSPDTIEADLKRRDFTINAMAVSLLPDDFGKLIDPFAGAADLEKKILRILHDNSFIDDPTRILRGLRFADRFAFEDRTDRLIRYALKERAFDTVSGVRIKRELRLILEENRRGWILELCREFGIGNAIQAGFEFRTNLFYPDDLVKAAWDMVFECEAGGYAEPWLAGLAAASAGISPEAMRSLAERLDATHNESEALIRTNEASDPKGLEIRDDASARQSQIAELLWDLPHETLVYLYAAGGEIGRSDITNFLRVVKHVKLEISGDDLIARGHKPSRRFSEVLKEVLRQKRDGLLKSAEEELQLAETLLKENE
jgi:tRNA nucleotidyltransferase (CCA-adding enzyme)